MKVIIVQDYDGHLNAFKYNREHLKFFLTKALDHLPSSFEDREQVEVILHNPDAKEKDLEYHLKKACGRSNGNHIDVLKVQTTTPTEAIWA